jgi:UDP-2,3-diacylglucosamine pyrophosphatase LpxH
MMQTAVHTIVLSDMHLADAEPVHESNPLWKRYKRRKYFTDKQFADLLEHAHRGAAGAPLELVLNGDIFDFDSVMVLPEQRIFPVNWVERLRGLASEEPKSLFKIGVILSDHHVFVDALREFLRRGHRIVFVIGNHDVELHWPKVQEEILRRLEPEPGHKADVRFCEWFYISNQDTLIEHGNQFDDYCVCSDPIHPLIRRGKKILVRLPFGNVAGKLITNGMGLMNPHVEASFIKETVREYFVFFYRYMLRVQPTVLWTWAWGAMATLYQSLREGFLPALKDPLMVEERVEQIAARSNATPSQVRLLRELHAHPAIFNPVKVMRELWLDRLALFLFIFFVGFEIYTFLNLFTSASIGWFLIPVAILFPPFLFYAKSVQSEVKAVNRKIMKRLPLSQRITNCQRVIQGHTHVEAHRTVAGVEYINTGTWSPAYEDPECTRPSGRKCFAWIRPGEGERPRVATLFEWRGDQAIEILKAD